MRIFADLTALLNYPCGIATYLIRLYQRMMAMDDTIQLASGQNSIRHCLDKRFARCIHDLLSSRVIVANQPFPGRIRLYEHPLLLRLFSLPTGKYDVCHVTGNFAPSYFPVCRWDNVVLTIHDLFAFHPEIPHYLDSGSPWHQEFRKYQKEQAMKARHIVTVSEFTKRDIMEKFDISPDKISVIPNATQWSDSNDVISQQPDSSEIEEVLARPFYLAVSNIAPHKNYDNLCTAWKAFRESREYRGEKLVIVGRDDLTELSGRVNGTPDVIRLRGISPSSLRTLYSRALGFFAIAFFEGFGIPLLEAMSCGCLACYAKGTSMDEIGRDACYSLKPDETDAIQAMFATMRDVPSEERRRRIARELEIAREYTWKRIARDYLDIFRAISK